jgi:hypothetical protein
MTSTDNRLIHIPHVTPASRLAHVFLHLKSGNLLALGQILDDHPDNIATLTSKHAHIAQSNKTIVTGYRDHTTNGMWHIHNSPKHTLNTILHKRQPKTQLAIFLHTTLFSPAPSTLIKAIKIGYLSTWPGLTPELISKHLPPQIATMKGHLDQEAKGLQSTRPNPMDEPAPTDNWHIVVTQQTNNVMIDTLHPTDKTYSPTGNESNCSPKISSTEHLEHPWH